MTEPAPHPADPDRNADLLGLRAVVTGAGHGIGAAIAHRLAAGGATVAVLDVDADGARDTVRAISTAGGEAHAVGCDVSDPAAVDAAADEVVGEIGGCDVLVNNAGIVRPGPLEGLDPADWRTVQSVNLDGVFLCMRRFARPMLEAGHGAIVNIASIAALTPSPITGAYSAAKAGIAALTAQAAVEWGPRGVRVNAVCPGLVDNPMGGSSMERSAEQLAMVPLGRLCRKEDVAELVAFLSSERAAYITGAAIPVDGGLTQGMLSAVQRAS